MPKKIKILFTISNFNTSGSGKVVYDLVKGLDREVFEPEVCCQNTKGNLFNEIEKLNVKVHVFPFKTVYRPLLSFPFRIFKIYKFFKENQFDIIHSWHWSSDFSEPLAAKLAGVKYIFTKKAMGWGNKAWTWRSKLSTKIVAVNEDMITQFYKNTSMMPKIVRIPVAVDVNYFQPLVKTNKTPEGVVFNENDFVIVSVANLVPVKGIEILLEAVNTLNGKNCKVFIVGNYNNEYGLSLKEQYEANQNFTFLGKHLDVRPYLAMADLFVIPTKDIGEGLPVAPMEAMASSRIVIGSNVSGVKDVLKEFPKCIFTSNDVNDLAEKITYIKNMNLAERQKLAASMRSYVERELSVKMFLNKHEELYKNLTK